MRMSIAPVQKDLDAGLLPTCVSWATPYDIFGRQTVDDGNRVRLAALSDRKACRALNLTLRNQPHALPK